MTTIWIDWLTGRAKPCFWLIVENGVIKCAPPIARWTVGKSVRTVVRWYRENGATVLTS